MVVVIPADPEAYSPAPRRNCSFGGASLFLRGSFDEASRKSLSRGLGVAGVTLSFMLDDRPLPSGIPVQTRRYSNRCRVDRHSQKPPTQSCALQSNPVFVIDNRPQAPMRLQPPTIPKPHLLTATPRPIIAKTIRPLRPASVVPIGSHAASGHPSYPGGGYFFGRPNAGRSEQTLPVG